MALGERWTFYLLFLLQFVELLVSQRAPQYCPDERRLENGFVTYSIGRFYSQTQLTNGVRKRFECFRGWSIAGAFQAECRNGRWSARIPTCVQDSCNPIREEVNNLYTVYYSEEPVRGNYLSGTGAHIYCNPDTILVKGDGDPVCEMGSWLPEIPLCLHKDLVDEHCVLAESDLPDGVRLINPDIVKEGGVVNHFGVLEFRCVPGYSMDGSDITTCIDGEWSQPLPQCTPTNNVDYETCGQTKGTRSRVSGNRGGRVRRIVSGFDAQDHVWPWQAALYWLNADREWVFLCGGALISPDWVLSAAHCFQQDEDITDVQVRLGLTNRARHGGTPREQKISIDGLYIPQGFNFVGFDYDVALLHLSRSAALNPFVRTVCLPDLPTESNFDTSLGLVEANAYGMVTGWGSSTPIHFHNSTSSDSRAYSKKLQQLEVPIKQNKTCQNSLKKRGEDPRHYTERMFCAGYSKRSRGPCFGDSGGPVVREIITPVGGANSTEVISRWVQIGIVSNTISGCAVKGVYTFYTHVPFMMNWIDGVLQGIHTPSERQIYFV